MQQLFDALSQLTRQDPTPEHFSEFMGQVNAEKNDRGAAILLACNAEIALRYAIRRQLTTTEDAEAILFRFGGPLRSFEAKIRVGYAMGLYREQTKNNLDCIRSVRNAFAHSVIPIRFDTLQVKAVCDLMTMPEIMPPRAVDPPTGLPQPIPGSTTTRQRFQRICEAVSHNIFLLGVHIAGAPIEPKEALSTRAITPLA